MSHVILAASALAFLLATEVRADAAQALPLTGAPDEVEWDSGAPVGPVANRLTCPTS
ncbi:hypothetical protein [Roseobacter sp. A03A-229]